jgi:tetratricopeptide (TPR) repeat protein
LWMTSALRSGRRWSRKVERGMKSRFPRIPHAGRFLRLLLLAAALLAAGCAATATGPVLEEGDEQKETLLADSRYGLSNIPEDLPPQRAASFRVAARGVLAWKEGRLQEAEDRLERALTLDPRNPFCYFYLAEIRAEQGEIPQALLFLNQAELLFQEHPYWLGEVYAKKGKCLEALRDTEAASRAYTRALEYNPWNEIARKGLERVGPSRG